MTDQMVDLPTDVLCVHTPLSDTRSHPVRRPLASCDAGGWLFRATFDDGEVLWLHAGGRMTADDWARYFSGGRTAVVDGPSGPSTVNADGTITHQPPADDEMLGDAAMELALAVGGAVQWDGRFPRVGWDFSPEEIAVVDVDGRPAAVFVGVDRQTLPAPLPVPTGDGFVAADAADAMRQTVGMLRTQLDGTVDWSEPRTWLLDVPLDHVDGPAEDVARAVERRLVQRPVVRVGGSVGGMLDDAPGRAGVEVLEVVHVAVATGRAVAVVRGRQAPVADADACGALAHRFADSSPLWRDGDYAEDAGPGDYEVAHVGVPQVHLLPLSGRAHTDAVRAASELLGTHRRLAATAASQFGGLADRSLAVRRAFVFLLADMAAGRTSGAALEALWAAEGTPFGRDGSVWSVGLAGGVVTVDPSDLSTVEDGGVAVPTGLPAQCPNPWRVVRTLAALQL